MSTERNRRWFGGAVQTASLSPVHTTAAVGLEKDVNLLAENDTNGNDRTLIVCVFAWHIRNVVLPQQARAHTVLWERRIDYEYIHVRHKRSLLTELLPECPARDDYVRTVPRPSPIQNSHNTSDAGHTNLAPRPTAENLATLSQSHLPVFMTTVVMVFLLCCKQKWTVTNNTINKHPRLTCRQRL